MLALKYLEDNFELFSIRVKTILFLVPLLLVFIASFMILNNQSSEISSNIKLLDINSIKMKTKIVDILKDIENYSLENEIVLINIKNSKNDIKLELESSIKKRIEFLNYLEHYNSFSKIRSFELLENRLIIEVEFKKFYKKDKISLNEEINLLENKRIKSKLTLQAIVGKKALINNRWLKLDDKIDLFRVKAIENRKVLLENSYKTLTLKLHKK